MLSPASPAPSLLLVTDPVGGPDSVQFGLLSALSAQLRNHYRLTVYTPFCDPATRPRLRELSCDLLTPPGRRFVIHRLLQRTGGGNESMLWAESWLREALYRQNSSEVAENVDPGRFDHAVNLSMTVPAPSNLWWILGTPLEQTIGGMSRSNVVAGFADLFFRRTISTLDRRVLGRIQYQSARIVANSPYLRDLYRHLGISMGGVIYTLTDLSDFRPTGGVPDSKYVLLYLGKETDPIDFEALTRDGVRLIAFGSKIPVGMPLNEIRRYVDFRGRVSRQELIRLYSQARFTLFPFTFEPMGLVPIESMACGTPVLTYNRQGPASTVVDGKTGWLVETPEEMVAKAVELWHRRDLGVLPEDCMRRAEEFTVQRSVRELISWLDTAPPPFRRTAQVMPTHMAALGPPARNRSQR